MEKSEKNKGGRPAIGAGEQINLRWRPEDLRPLDEWRLSQPKPVPRSEAIRILVARALSAGL